MEIHFHDRMIIQTLRYCLPSFYANIAFIGRSMVDYNRSSFPLETIMNKIIQEFRRIKKAEFHEDAVLF